MANIFLTQVPKDLVNAVKNGEAVVRGVTIANSSTGQIMGHLQQTSALTQSIASIPINPISGTLNTVSNLGQNYQLFQIQNSLNKLNLVTNLTAVTSVLNLGLCAAGFFVINKKLNNLDTKTSNIERKLDIIINKQFAQESALIENAIQACIIHYNDNNEEAYISTKDYIKPISDLIKEKLKDTNFLGFFNKRKVDIGQFEYQTKTLNLLININIQLILLSEKPPLPFIEDTIEKLSKHITTDKKEYFNLLKIQMPYISTQFIPFLKQQTIIETDSLEGLLQGMHCKKEILQTLKNKSISTSKYIENLKEFDDHNDFVFLPI